MRVQSRLVLEALRAARAGTLERLLAGVLAVVGDEVTLLAKPEEEKDANIQNQTPFESTGRSRSKFHTHLFEQPFCGQAKGFSPVCTRRCIASAEFDGKLFVHSLHENLGVEAGLAALAAECAVSR
jgi:hypothetical protein